MLRRFTVCAAAGASLLLAHFSWINPLSSPLTAGAEVQVQIAHGHAFPESEEMFRPQGIRSYVLASGGERTELKPLLGRKKLLANFKVPREGHYRFVFIQDRGVLSRTPKGLLPGGRDAHPDAHASARHYRSGVAWAATANAAKSPRAAAGLEFEMVAEASGDRLQVTVLHNGKPCADAEVISKRPGRAEEKLGLTGAGGRIAMPIADGLRAPLLLEASKTAAAPAGASYDKVNLSTSLYLESL